MGGEGGWGAGLSGIGLGGEGGGLSFVGSVGAGALRCSTVREGEEEEREGGWGG